MIDEELRVRRSVDKAAIEAAALEEFSARCDVLDRIQHRIGELEDTIDALDEDIDRAESYGLDDTVEHMCRARNELNSNRINLELERLKLEKEIFEFEQAMNRRK